MKIIDFETKGNLVRFYYGENDTNDYWGDDWNDAPYEHNAGKVYDQYIKGFIDVAFNYNCKVLQPEDSYITYQGNTPWSKNSMKNKEIPCIIVIPTYFNNNPFEYEEQFVEALQNKNSIKFYFGDPIPTDKTLIKIGKIL